MPRHKARKRFGQNFLIDDQIIGQISDIFKAPAVEHRLIEIGPGRGALTEALLQQGQTLTALELDRDLIPILQTKFSHYRTFTLHQGDALQTNFTELANGLPLRLVGNLPYNVATPLIFKLLEDINNIIDLHFMLQWEVVARLCAQEPLVDSNLHETFNRIVKTSFAHRRKTLRNNLKGVLDSEQIADAGVDPGGRAETVSIEGYAALAELVGA